MRDTGGILLLFVNRIIDYKMVSEAGIYLRYILTVKDHYKGLVILYTPENILYHSSEASTQISVQLSLNVKIRFKVG